MIPQLRQAYNAAFDPLAYHQMIEAINREYNHALDFRVCETPGFLPPSFDQQLRNAAAAIIRQLRHPDFSKSMEPAIPENYHIAGEPQHPAFLAIDFAIVRGSDGALVPKLIELQAFATTFFFEWLLDEFVGRYLPLPDNLTSFYSGHSRETLRAKLRRLIVADADPEKTILLEIEPEKQKTRIDFVITERETGVQAVCISKLIRRGNKLWHRRGGREVPVDRIYNRLIFDELEPASLPHGWPFDPDLEVDWVGHPNWFYKISKYSMPQLKDASVPHCFRLSELQSNPVDLQKYVLKPLFSFAGSGVVLDVTPEILEGIQDRDNYLLQQKVVYEPILETPHGLAKAEIRMVFLWEQEPQLVQNHLRVSRGAMMGVDFNKDKTWVGSSLAYHIT